MSIHTAKQIQSTVANSSGLPACQRVIELITIFEITGLISAASLILGALIWTLSDNTILNVYMVLSVTLTFALCFFYKLKIDKTIQSPLDDREYYWLVNELTNNEVRLDHAEKEAAKANWATLLIHMERFVANNPSHSFIHDLMGSDSAKAYF